VSRSRRRHPPLSPLEQEANRILRLGGGLKERGIRLNIDRENAEKGSAARPINYGLDPEPDPEDRKRPIE
jgi:hypothetical protein